LPAALAALVLLGMARAAPLSAQIDTLDVRVDSLVVRGANLFATSEIASASGLRVGTRVTYADIQTALRRLMATQDFDDVQIKVTAGPPAVFYIDIVERPRVGWYYFRGLKNVSATTIEDSIGLFSGEPLNPGKIHAARVMIRQILANSGYPSARVDTLLTQAPTGEYNVTFEVHEGPKLALARIEFIGNESFTDRQLADAMKTGEEGFFWFSSGQLKRDEFLADLSQRLPDFYARRGFIDFSVVNDTVVVDTTTGKGRVEIHVSEGPRFKLVSFEVEGNKRFPNSQLKAFLQPAREGMLDYGTVFNLYPPFDQPAFNEALGKASDMYRDAGYLQIRIIPTVERLPPESPGEDPRIAARWTVIEGEPSYVRHVTIVGNDYTHDRVIRQRLFVLPGDIYSQQLLIESLKAISALGFFETLPPMEAVQITPSETGDVVDITFRVKEAQTGNINFGVSATAATGFAGFIGYDQPNLFGLGKVGHFRFVFGGRTTDIEVSYTDPEIFGTRKSLSVGLQASRDQFTTFSLGDRRQTGGFTEVGSPIMGLRSTRVFVGYSLFYDDVTDLDEFGISPQQAGLITSGTRSSLSFRIVRDTRGGGLFPTSGNRNTASWKHTGGILGGDGDYSKVDVVSEWFVPVGQIGGGFEKVPIEIVLGLIYRAGLTIGDNPFFQDRYFMGGTQVGIQLRGYGEATVTPLGHVPRNAPVSDFERVGQAYFATTAQLGVKLTDNIFFSTFIDAGNTWFKSSQFNPTDLLTAAGVGASLVTPFGPIGLDYAYGFDRRDVLGRPDPGWKLNFRFGTVF
jgi:outer membrane protein insertion porin family